MDASSAEVGMPGHTRLGTTMAIIIVIDQGTKMGVFYPELAMGIKAEAKAGSARMGEANISQVGVDKVG